MSAPAVVESAQDSDRTFASFERFFPGMDLETLNGIVAGVKQGSVRFSPFDLHLPVNFMMQPYFDQLQKVWKSPVSRQAYLARNAGDKPHFMLVDDMLRGAQRRADITAFFMLTGPWMLPLVAFMDPRVEQLTWRPCSLTMCGAFA